MSLNLNPRYTVKVQCCLLNNWQKKQPTDMVSCCCLYYSIFQNAHASSNPIQCAHSESRNPKTNHRQIIKTYHISTPTKEKQLQPSQVYPSCSFNFFLGHFHVIKGWKNHLGSQFSYWTTKFQGPQSYPVSPAKAHTSPKIFRYWTCKYGSGKNKSLEKEIPLFKGTKTSFSRVPKKMNSIWIYMYIYIIYVYMCPISYNYNLSSPFKKFIYYHPNLS